MKKSLIAIALTAFAATAVHAKDLVDTAVTDTLAIAAEHALVMQQQQALQASLGTKRAGG